MSVANAALTWGISERSVRNYCTQGRVPGAELIGKTWRIPADAAKPVRANARARTLLDVLRRERAEGISGGIYHRVQVDLAFNSNHMEGSVLSHEQTRLIFETKTIGCADAAIPVDDIIETVNHFRCFDLVLDKANHELSLALLRELHEQLKAGTTDAGTSWFAVGDFKRLPNEVGGRATTAPEDVENALRDLLRRHHAIERPGLEDIVAFHVELERIHPFQDGNGRVGRLLMFKECLRCNIVPFVLADDMKFYYYRGLSEWDEERGYLMGTCEAAQDRFRALLDYFRIPQPR